MHRRAHLLAFVVLASAAAACGLDAVPTEPKDRDVGNDAAAGNAAPDASVDGTVEAAADGGDGGAPIDAAAHDATTRGTFDAGIPPLREDGGAGSTGGDAGEDAAGATEVVDAAVPASAKQLLAASTANLQILGVTGDGYVVYQATDGSGVATVSALKLDGTGSPETITSGHAIANVLTTTGPGALLWADCNFGLAACTLLSWTASAHAHTAPDLAVYPFAWMTPDGQDVLYATSVNSNATTATLTGATIAFGGPATYATFATGYGASPTNEATSCFPTAQFASGRLALFAYCQPDTFTAEVDAIPYPFAADAAAPLATTASATLALDTSGSRFATLTSFYRTDLFVDSGATVQEWFGQPTVEAVDGSVLWPSGGQYVGWSLTYATPPFVYLSHDGTTILFEEGQGLYGAGVDDGGDPYLIAPNPGNALAVSPDESLILAYSRANATLGLENLLLVQDVAGAPTPLVLLPQINGFPNAPAFTNDSSHAVYLGQGYYAPQGGSFVGTLYTAPADGGAARRLATTAGGAFVAGPSGVLYWDDAENLAYLDTRSPAPPVVMLAGTCVLDVWSDVSSTQLVFLYSCGTTTAGLYVMPAVP